MSLGQYVLAVAGAELTYGVTLATVAVLTDLLFSATLYGSRRTSQLVVWASGVRHERALPPPSSVHGGR